MTPYITHTFFFHQLTLTLVTFLSVTTLSAQSLPYHGYPSRGEVPQLKENFRNPPKGYGNVPFYWWNGDTLKYEVW